MLLISREARERLGLATGVQPELSSPAAARLTAAPLAAEGLNGATLTALDRLSTTFEHVVDLFLSEVGESPLRRALEALDRRLGREAVDQLLEALAEEFTLEEAEVRTGRGAGDSRRLGRLQRLLLFWWLEANPAAERSAGLLLGSAFRRRPLVLPALGILERELSRPEGERWPGGLTGKLLEPVQRSPGSLAGQLRWIGRHWSVWLPDTGEAWLRAADLVDEETPRLPPGPDPGGHVEEPAFADLGETRDFTPDRDWMPTLVLVAKNVRVWLHQLSRFYGRPIQRLDEIPESELRRLRELGITGLWLIGIWERSRASARIKQLAGNPEALGSAYSILRYRIAEDLGGEEALAGLTGLAWRCGLRLAADMVPNHYAIDADWVLDRPEWFIGTDECPYPGYTFDGPELSPRPEISLRIEDGYWDRSDAAVVFRWRDNASGRTRFLYHGNDGTGMPWNDTAQLDFLRADVREAVMRQILDVARRFSVVRFDAAMTLARRHFRRLWYPPPGEGGDIPSRAERGLSVEAFDEEMPREFWREVVDRAAREAPDALLLAEAFWLMEGYFVRSLGMHRVYNSAFMNLLRNGETGRLRRLMAETLAFDPEILKRYVNFLSNPDERTAEQQFGTGDRYFGVCTILATLPGLPMFAHGQLEGLKERYGMEYGRSYVEELPDAAVIERHRREITPLLESRPLYAGCEAFQLFEVLRPEGEVAEDVLAYANAHRGEAVLVVFNHSAFPVVGRIQEALPARRDPAGEPESASLARAVGLPDGGLVHLRDRQRGLSYLARAEEVVERGLEVSLGPYETRVLQGFEPAGAELEELARQVGTRGVPDLARAQRELELAPVREAVRRVVEAPAVTALSEARELPDEEALDGLEEALLELARGVASWQDRKLAPGALAGRFHARSRALLLLPTQAAALARSKRKERREAGESARSLLSPGVLKALAWGLAVEALQRGLDSGEGDPVAEWELDRSPAPEGAALARRRGWGREARLPESGEGIAMLERWIAASEEMGEEMGKALGRHAYEGVEYLRREALVRTLGLRVGQEALAWSDRPSAEASRALEAWAATAAEALELAAAAGYRVSEILSGESPEPGERSSSTTSE